MPATEPLDLLRRAFPDGCLPLDCTLTRGGWRCVGVDVSGPGSEGAPETVTSRWLPPVEEGHVGTGNTTTYTLVTDLEGAWIGEPEAALVAAMKAGDLLPAVTPEHAPTWHALLDWLADALDLETAQDATGVLWFRTDEGDWTLLADFPDDDDDDDDAAVFVVEQEELEQATGARIEDDPAMALVCLFVALEENALDDEADAEIEAAWRDDGEPWERAWVDEVVGAVSVKGNRAGARGIRWHNVYVQEEGGPQQKWAYCPSQTRWARQAEPPQEVLDALLSAGLGAPFDVSDLPSEPQE